MAAKPPGLKTAVVGQMGSNAARLISQAQSRAMGMLTRQGKDWETALEHISLHFHADPLKPTHSVFASYFREQKNLINLLRQAISKPSTAQATKLTDGNTFSGRPAVEFARGFRKQIGMRGDQTWLIVIVALDRRGEIITAYPITDPT